MWHSRCAAGEIRGEDDKSTRQITRLCVYYSGHEHGIHSARFFFREGKNTTAGFKYRVKNKKRGHNYGKKKEKKKGGDDDERESESPSEVLVGSSSFGIAGGRRLSPSSYENENELKML